MYNVLIVEDHDRLRDQLGKFYEQEGFRVATALRRRGYRKLAQENIRSWFLM
jgi:DNA-binding response OmpR family regulator